MLCFGKLTCEHNNKKTLFVLWECTHDRIKLATSLLWRIINDIDALL